MGIGDYSTDPGANTRVNHGTIRRIMADLALARDDGTFGGNNVVTQADATVMTVSSLKNIRTAGYSAAGDGGGALYKRAVSEPSHLGKFQSADGGWWELAENEITLEMFGGKADGAIVGTSVTGTDNLAAMNAALAYGRANYGGSANAYGTTATIRLGRGKYRFSDKIKIDHMVRIVGATGAPQGNTEPGSILYFPQNTIGFYLLGYQSPDPDTGVPSTIDAGGTVLEYFRIATPPGSTDTTKHGIVLKTRAVINQVRVSSFGGDGINIVASAGVTGNANNFYLNGCICIGNQSGIYVNGPDANAGVAYNCDGSSNRAWGIWDSSFLGNTWVGCHVAGNGLKAQVHYQGNRYYCLNPALAGLTIPGTNSTVWAFYMVGGVHSQFPEWAEDGSYVIGGSYQADDASARSVFVGCYSEGDQPPANILRPSMALGGLLGSHRGSGLVLATDGVQGKFVARQALSGGAGPGGYVTLGATDLDLVLLNGIGDHSTGTGLAVWDATNGNYLIGRSANLSSRTAFKITAHNTLFTGGRVSPVLGGYAVLDRGVFVGAGASARYVTNATAIPTAAGEYARGEIVFNSTPTAGGKAGWICTTGGTLASAWVTGTNYAVDSYILAGNGRYYKCTIDGGASSTVEPTHTTGAVTEADGFQWTHIGNVAAIWKPWGAIDA